MTVDSPPRSVGRTAKRGGFWRKVVNADAEAFLAPGLVVLVIVAALSAYLTLQSDQTAVLARSANELRLINLKLNNKISDAETSQLGFLLTSDRSYLAPYEEAEHDIPELGRQLLKLAESDPGRQALARRAGELAKLKLGEIRKTIELQKRGDAAAAIALVHQDIGKKYFDELRSVLAELSDEASDDAEARREQARAQRQWLMGATLAGLILSAILSVIALTRTRRQLGELRERHRTLVDINEMLEQRVAERTAELKEAKAETERERDQVKALLADVNHRIGNNLQLVSSMLAFHARFAAGEEARDTLQAARNQVQSIASAQRRLRLLGTSDEVELENFMAGLLEDLRETLTADRPIKIELSASPARVSSRTAVSIGVIVSELINNAVKHAFRDGLAGIVQVVIATADGSRVQEVVVADNGVGIPSTEVHTSGLGGKIIQALADSLNASVTVEAAHPGLARPGTRVRLNLAETAPAA